MKPNKEQIIKALECCINDECDKCGVPFGNCQANLMQDALALIKKLYEENAAWQKQLISTEEKTGQAYYELACEVENLRSENERLMKALNTDISIVRVSRGSGKTAHLREVLRIKADAIRADTVRKMRERLTTFFAADDTLKYSEVDAEYINSQIIKISKEMEER